MKRESPNLIVRTEVWERFHSVARHAAGMIVSGRLRNHADVIHLLVDRMEDVTPMVSGVDRSGPARRVRGRGRTLHLRECVLQSVEAVIAPAEPNWSLNPTS